MGSVEDSFLVVYQAGTTQFLLSVLGIMVQQITYKLTQI